MDEENYVRSNRTCVDRLLEIYPEIGNFSKIEENGSMIVSSANSCMVCGKAGKLGTTCSTQSWRILVSFAPNAMQSYSSKEKGWRSC